MTDPNPHEERSRARKAYLCSRVLLRLVDDTEVSVEDLEAADEEFRERTAYCELTRIALDRHHAPVTMIVARALRLLRESNPGLRLVISFADPKEGHVGTIYQAGGWIYTGMSSPVVEYRIGGRWRHTRGAYWHPDRARAPKRTAPGKHRYLFPLDRAMRRRVEPLRVRFVRGPGIESDPPSFPDGGSGATPEVRSQ